VITEATREGDLVVELSPCQCVVLIGFIPWLLVGRYVIQAHWLSLPAARRLNFKNIKIDDFAVIDWNYTAYSKVRDQEVGGSNPLAPTNLIPITSNSYADADEVRVPSSRMNLFAFLVTALSSLPWVRTRRPLGMKPGDLAWYVV